MPRRQHESETGHPFPLAEPVSIRWIIANLTNASDDRTLFSGPCSTDGIPQPRERPLHRPPNRKQHPAHCFLRALHDVQSDAACVSTHSYRMKVWYLLSAYIRLTWLIG